MDSRTFQALLAAETTGLNTEGRPVHGRTMLRGLALLELIAESGPLTASTLAQESGIDKGTASRLLTSLRETGYIQQDPKTRRYTLGSKAIWLWLRFTEQFPVARVGGRAAAALSEATGESATVDVLVQDGVECLVAVDSAHALRVSHHVGENYPLDSAPGRAMLTTMDDDEMRTLLQQGRGAARVLPPRDAERGISEARDDGVLAVSAAIAPASGQSFFALTVWAPLSRAEDRAGELAEAVRQQAAQLSAQLGVE